MTEPSPERPPTSGSARPRSSHSHPPPSPPFAPIFTLVNNTSTQTTHHPQVHYIFSDDDPDILTQALAGLDPSANESINPDPAYNHRAAILDLAPDAQGGYKVAWASSLSPSWAVLDAQLTQISAPSSEGDGGGDHQDDQPRPQRLDRLMLRIEGTDSDAVGFEGDLGLSGDGSKPGSGSTSGAGSSHKDRTRIDGEDYGPIISDFEKRMALLRRVARASEERRELMGAGPESEREEPGQPSHSPNPAD